MVSPHHFWRSTFAFTFLAQGSLAFGLPTHNGYEIIARLIFILIGLAFIWAFRSKIFALRLLVVSVIWVVLWLFFALIQIYLNRANPNYGIHLFYLPYWALLIRLHYKAIQDIKNEL